MHICFVIIVITGFDVRTCYFMFTKYCCSFPVVIQRTFWCC